MTFLCHFSHLFSQWEAQWREMISAGGMKSSSGKDASFAKKKKQNF
jgi:hypothetical protein